MSNDAKNLNISRRHFVTGAAALAAIPVVIRNASGQEMPVLKADDPTAVALKYVPNAADADQSVRGGDDRYCSNCALYSGAADSGNGPCSIFPGKLVSANGWCSVWAPKPAN